MKVSEIGRWFRLVCVVTLLLFSTSLWAQCFPAIATQPVSTTALEGSTASFSVTANDGGGSCTANLAYQWQYLGTDTFWHTFPATSSTPAQAYAGNEEDAAQNIAIPFSISNVLLSGSPAVANPATLPFFPAGNGDNGISIQVLITDSGQNKVASNTVTLTVLPNWWLPSSSSLPSGVGTFEAGALLPSGHLMAIGDDSTTINVDTTPGIGETTGSNPQPQQDTWIAAPESLPTMLLRPTATLLPTGDVLIAGGLNGSADQNGSYLYTEGSSGNAGVVPATTNPMNTARDSHTASLLYNGLVLVAGGIDDGVVQNSFELYNPATQAWTQPSSATMVQGRYRHDATVLVNGTVLVTGGQSTSATTTALASAELYNPVANTWTAVGNMHTTRVFHTSTLLPNGDVLITGGNNDLGQPLNTAEIYDPVAKTFTLVAATMVAKREQHAATLMASGKVLIEGGANSAYLATSEYFDPTGGNGSLNPATETTAQVAANGSFTSTATMTFNPPTNAVVPAPVDRQAAWLVRNGSVVAAGGTTTGDIDVALAEKFQDYGQGTPGLPTASVYTTVNGLSASAACGPVNANGTTQQSGVTFAWTVLPAGNVTGISYPNYPDTSTIDFTLVNPAVATTVDCVATSSLGIPVTGTATVLTANIGGGPDITVLQNVPGGVTFSETSVGGTAASYQWQYEDNGVWKNWGTASTQAIASPQPYSNDMPVRVIVTDATGTDTSVPVILYVVATPVITGEAATPSTIISAINGGAAYGGLTLGPSALSVTVTPISQVGISSGNTVSTQWCAGSTPSISSCTSSPSSVDSGSIAGGVYPYYAIVTNTLNGVPNAVASPVVNVTVDSLPTVSITTNAGADPNTTPTIVQGGNITFSSNIGVAGYPASYTYQWQYEDNGAWKNWGTASTQALTSAQAYSDDMPVRLQVTNAAGVVTAAQVTLYVVSAPSITSATASPSTITSAINGGPTNTGSTLSVAATSDGTLSYQWCAGSSPSTNIGSCGGGLASGSSVNVDSGSIAGGVYPYYVIVTNTINGVTNAVASGVVNVTVNSLPTASITNSPGGATPTILQGAGITFTASIGSAGYPASYTYQWQYEDNGAWKNWGTASTQALTSAQPYSDDMPVRLQVTNAAGTVTTSTVTLYVVATPSFTQPTTPLNVMSGATPSFSVSAVTPANGSQAGISSPNSITYQWCVGASPSTTCGTPAGSTTATLSPSTGTGGVFNYYLIVTNTLNGVANAVASNDVQLTVNVEPTVAINSATLTGGQPATTATPTVVAGASITFSAPLSGSYYPSTGYTYQWQYEDSGVWKNWGAASTQLLSSVATYSDDMPVRVIVSNSNWPGYVSSAPATSTNTVTAGPVTLYVVSTPTSVTVAQTAPTPATGTVGQSANVSFTASAAAALTGEATSYAWYKGTAPGGTLISSGDTPSYTGAGSANCSSTYSFSGSGNSVLTVNDACLGDSGSYYAVATNTGADADVTSSGVTSNSVTLTVDVGQWTPDGSMNNARYDAMSLMLPDGTFYVAGGENDTVGLLNNDAIYTPVTATTGTWSTSGSTFVAGPHLDGTATLLPDGDVLIAGGSDGQDGKEGVEYYHSGSKTYTGLASTGQFPQPTTMHVAALLPSQSVLLAGGQNGWSDTFYNNAYLIDPIYGNASTEVMNPSSAHLSVARALSRAVTLGDGRILIVGGQDINGIDNAVDIYDGGANADYSNATLYPSSLYTLSGSAGTAGSPGTFGDFFAQANCADLTAPTPCMATPRLYHTATLLNDGRVLVAGGVNNSGIVQATLEIWDHLANGGAGGFYPVGATAAAPTTANPGTLITARMMHSAVLLANGKVLIFGGSDGVNALTTAEVVDPNWTYSTAHPSASIAASSLIHQRQQTASTLLPQGTVITAGGFHPTSKDPTHTEATAEIFSALEGYTSAPTPIGNSIIGVGGILSATSPASGWHDPGDGFDYLSLGVSLPYSINVVAASGNILTNFSWTTPSETLNSGQGQDGINFTTPPAVDYSLPNSPTTPYNIDAWVMNQYGFSTWLTPATENVINYCTGGCFQQGQYNGNTYQAPATCPSGYSGTSPNCTAQPPTITGFGVANSSIVSGNSTNFTGSFSGAFNASTITASPSTSGFPQEVTSPLTSYSTGDLTTNTTFTLTLYNDAGNVVASSSVTVTVTSPGNIVVNQWYSAQFGTTVPSALSGPPGADATDGPVLPSGFSTSAAAPSGTRWTITLTGPGTLTVTDLEDSGDQFQMYDNGALMTAAASPFTAGGQNPGQASPGSGKSSNPCVNCASVGEDINAALGNADFSSATFALSTGVNVITGNYIGSVGGGDMAFIVEGPQ